MMSNSCLSVTKGIDVLIYVRTGKAGFVDVFPIGFE